MSETVVEIHVPLTAPSDLPEGEYRFPWIETITEYLLDLDGDRGEVHDDGEEWGDEYVFFVSGAGATDLLSIARAVAALPDVPLGAYAMVTDSDAEEFGLGERVDLD